jgi:Flp pilus assembly protein TadG
VRNNRGSSVIETILVMPLILILFFITIWGGQLMFTWTGVNYSATTAAMDAAKTGEVTEEIGQSALEQLKQWTPGGRDLGTSISRNAGGPQGSQGEIVLWTPNVGPVAWKNDITIAIVYPYKVDSPLLSFLGESFFGGNVIYLKGEAVAQSEVLPEP